MRAFALLLAFFSLTQTAEAGIWYGRESTSSRISQRFEDEDLRGLARDAFSAMFKQAIRQLEQEGKTADAERIRSEWETHYSGVLMGIIPEDTGDHEPWNVWVAAVYWLLEQQFGVEYMEWSHLRDIWVLNFTLPVVFHPLSTEEWCLHQLREHPEDTCEKEYARHFVGTKYLPSDPLNTAALHHGFAGVIAYWVTWVACEIATYGTAAFIVCMPAGNVVETTIELFVAPGVAKRVWERNN